MVLGLWFFFLAADVRFIQSSESLMGNLRILCKFVV